MEMLVTRLDVDRVVEGVLLCEEMSLLIVGSGLWPRRPWWTC